MATTFGDYIASWNVYSADVGFDAADVWGETSNVQLPGGGMETESFVNGTGVSLQIDTVLSDLNFSFNLVTYRPEIYNFLKVRNADGTGLNWIFASSLASGLGNNTARPEIQLKAEIVAEIQSIVPGPIQDGVPTNTISFKVDSIFWKGGTEASPRGEVNLLKLAVRPLPEFTTYDQNGANPRNLWAQRLQNLGITS